MTILHEKKGFTLIELMIVVAIIGILAAIAIPNFLRFQAKSKQAEAKANLGSFHTALDSFRSEYGSYTTDLSVLGWFPSGSPRYDYGFQTDNPDPSGLLTATAGVSAGKNSADQLPGIVLTLMKKSDGSPLMAGDLPASTAAFTSYTIGAIGNLDDDATNDIWTMSQDRVLTNVSPNDVGS
jgi:type IV pilus assembly protein PilA